MFVQVTRGNLWLHCCFSAILGPTEPSAGLGTCRGKARLQGSQGNEDGLLEDKQSNRLWPHRPGPQPLAYAAISRVRGRRVGRWETGSASPTVTGHLQALPGKGLTSLLLSLLVCKMGLIIIPTSQGQPGRGR